jgi:dGTP triphosphohydrolase
MSGSTYRRTLLNIPKPPSSNQTREKERFELSTLNDKFADYVEKVRYLEAQNKKIQIDANYLTEKQEENCQNIKTLFETELTQLKQLAENLFKDKNTVFSNSQDTQVNSSSLHHQYLFFLFRILLLH